ncbi:fimbrial protein [Enterobacter cloacae]|uniref:fimbrial protein n=1 Tax=Enterobacter cloacae TaxID=550 RepID=UPI0013D517DD|nr:hypothetical protein [Enterobacter cloacae]
MSDNHKRFILELLRILCLLSFIVYSLWTATSFADNAVIDASIKAGTCDLSYPDGVSVNLGKIQSQDLIPKGNDLAAMAGFIPYNIKFNNCGLGVGNSVIKPKVVLSGNPVDPNGVDDSANQRWFFRENGTSHNYYIFVASHKDSVWKMIPDGGVNHGVYGRGDKIPVIIDSNGVGNLTLYLGVACYKTCQKDNTIAGSLDATMTFDAIYN